MSELPLDLSALSADHQDDLAAVRTFRQQLKEAREQLKQRFAHGDDIGELVRAQALIIDQILSHAWRRLLAADETGIALIAVGGYGRGELHPGSDIDILILLHSNEHDHYRAALERLVMFLWDIGLEIGHSVRSLDECQWEASQDVTIATNLMEARLLEGPASLYDELRKRTGRDSIWPSRDFFQAKWNEQTSRHHKYNDTAYNLEPNIKEGPGGLRDIQNIGWVAKRHFEATTLHDLVTHKFLTEKECADLIAGQNFLWRVRFALHTLTGRREDRLLFDHQRTIANQFGFEDDAEGLAVEKFMKGYYRAIKELSVLNEMLLQHFQEALLYNDDASEPAAINSRFQLNRGFIEARNENIFKRYPFALMEVFLLIQQSPEIKGVRATTIRLIRDHLDLINDKFRADLRNRSLFMEMLRQPQGLTHELRRMNRYGVLARYIPMFGRIVGLMQYDLFHAYTVDAHILGVVRNLRRMLVADYAAELPICSRMIQDIPKLEVLYLGALFHDIAKGRGGDHSEAGADDALEFCLQHGMSNYDARFVAWLVRNHLIMSSTAQRKDISDPDVITEFAKQVGDKNHLDYLYLLTVADIRATNATLWNSWKDSLLFELYNATKRALRRGLENPIDKNEMIEEVQQQARTLLLQQHVADAQIDRLWRNLGDDYFLRHSVGEVVWHTQAIIENDGKEFPLILIQQEALRGGTEIFIHTPVKGHLFATATRALDQMGLTVVDARVIQSDAGYTFDTYVVLEEGGEPISSVHRVEDILQTLRHDLNQPQQVERKINRRSRRQLKHFNTRTQVNFSHDAHGQRTIMELVTGDRPGLLCQIGRAFMDCDITLQNAKIATIGERVEDVFFITDAESQSLNDPARLDELRATLISYLDDAS